MPIALENRQSRARVARRRLHGIAQAALTAVGRARAEVHVTLVDDAAIRRLNARYRGTRKRTDVLAFDLRGPGPAPLLGEVIVSVDTAARQAAAVGVPLALELDLLVVHGILHLAGWDDARPRDARRMHEQARAILTRAHRRPPPARLWAGLLPHA
jgi:probable rRNA maturation factor